MCRFCNALPHCHALLSPQFVVVVVFVFVVVVVFVFVVVVFIFDHLSNVIAALHLKVAFPLLWIGS